MGLQLGLQPHTLPHFQCTHTHTHLQIHPGPVSTVVYSLQPHLFEPHPHSPTHSLSQWTHQRSCREARDLPPSAGIWHGSCNVVVSCVKHTYIHTCTCTGGRSVSPPFFFFCHTHTHTCTHTDTQGHVTRWRPLWSVWVLWVLWVCGCGTPLPPSPVISSGRERMHMHTCTGMHKHPLPLSPPVSSLSPSSPPSTHDRGREGEREREGCTLYIYIYNTPHPPPTTLHKTMLNAKLVSSTRVRLMLLSPPPSPPLRGREERAAAERWRHVPQGVLSPLPLPLSHTHTRRREGKFPLP